MAITKRRRRKYLNNPKVVNETWEGALNFAMNNCVKDYEITEHTTRQICDNDCLMCWHSYIKLVNLGVRDNERPSED